MSQIISTYELLLRQVGGAHLVSIKHAGALIGLHSQTTYNQVHKCIFPIPLVQTVGKRMVRIVDIAQYIDSLPIQLEPLKRELELLQTVKPVAKRGRPTKNKQVAHLSRGAAV